MFHSEKAALHSRFCGELVSPGPTAAQPVYGAHESAGAMAPPHFGFPLPAATFGSGFQKWFFWSHSASKWRTRIKPCFAHSCRDVTGDF